MSFSLAIVGRPNVGKSTLFNRLVGKRLALVDDQPGVTRDLREGEGKLGDLRFTVIDTAGLDDSTTGWGVSLAGKLKVGEKDDVRFSLSGGKGLGRYIGLNAVAGAVADATGQIEALESHGGLIAYRHPFSDTMRLNVGYSALHVDNPAFLPTTATKMVHSAYTALMWTAFEKVTFGLEFMMGERETEAGDKGRISRATFSTKLPF